MPQTWILRHEDAPPEEIVQEWAERLSISPLLADLLWRRGIRDMGEADIYLSPGLKHLAPLSAWPGLEAGAQVIADALNAGETFAVWGDYDVDGVTSTALVLDVLQRHGLEPLHYIPERGEGYGMNVPGVEKLHERGVTMLLTVDCGVSDHESIARAKELGMKVVVSDHHLPGDTLPDANVICNPKIAECPCPDLAGVGVVFFLMAAVNKLLNTPAVDIRTTLDLVALGTLADVVSLYGQNRILAKNGLLLIADAKRPGLAALKEASGYKISAPLGAGQVVFGLAPRINAAGRMGHANDALQMLLCPNLESARPFAKKLDELNTERRAEEDRILEEALAQAEEQKERLGLVLYAPHWHAGIIGIVASRVVEHTYKPTLLLCDKEEGGADIKGSGRSISEFDLHSALQTCDALAQFGGHRQAAGMSLARENLEQLREQFHQAAIAQLGDKPLNPRLKFDAPLGFELVDFTLLKELDLLQPFGMGNPEPVFTSPVLEVKKHRVFGKNHVALELRDANAGITLKGKAWRQAENLRPEHALGVPLRIAYTPKLDTYNGVASIDLRIKDWNRDK